MPDVSTQTINRRIKKKKKKKVPIKNIINWEDNLIVKNDKLIFT